jgi:hypothetical protein
MGGALLDISLVCSELSWSGESTVLVHNIVELEVVLTSALGGESCVVLSDCDGVHQLRIRCMQLRTSAVDDNTLSVLL